MNRSWNKILLAGAALVAGASLAQAGPIYTYNWETGDDGHVCNAGGVINWVQGEFDTNTNRLKWYANLGNHTRLRTDGFTLALTAGGQDLHEGETAQLFFDGKSPAFNPLDRPALTAYTYNGYASDRQPWYDELQGRSVSGRHPGT